MTTLSDLLEHLNAMSLPWTPCPSGRSIVLRDIGTIQRESGGPWLLRYALAGRRLVYPFRTLPELDVVLRRHAARPDGSVQP